ncbi:MAG: DUF1631 domain-containing protein [Methylococcaceae bacterium]|nr:DUF1631 domain-containing protein [Methylococcaceae bacterium]
MGNKRFPDPDFDPSDSGGVLPRYGDVVLACRELVVERFGSLFNELFDHVDSFVLAYAENAKTNEERNRCFEFMSSVLLHQASCERAFVTELGKGFSNFMEGRAVPLRAKQEPKQGGSKLSLVEKDDYEVSLAFAGMLHYANTEYSSHLCLLNHRLAILCGGVKLGEYSPLLPGSPAQVCDAIQNALDSLDIEIDHRLKVAFVQELDQRILRKAEPIYAAYNDILTQRQILPNLTLESIGYQPSEHHGADDAEYADAGTDETAAEAAGDDRPHPRRRKEDQQGAAADESSLDREIFQSIQEVLARRHQGARIGGVPAGAQASTNIPDLLSALKLLNLNVPPVTQQQYSQLSLDTVKESFSEQVARLGHIIKEQQVSTADADIIDLVGMLFEFILNDNTLPDSVKALLSHLHTPILKVALLDKKFFFRSKHPARRLLNALTQAGSLCNVDDGDEQGMFAKIQSIVDHVCQHFDDDTGIFETLLEEFNSFLEGFSRKSRVVEKRSVETAKGRERLREARQAVTREIIDRTWNRSVPKVVEGLLMGPWANLMVLTALRNGQEGDEWKKALVVVEDLLWSVEPKVSEADRKQVRQKLPEIQQALREGLNLIGDPEINTSAVLDELAAYHREMLDLPPEKVMAAKRPEPAAVPASAHRPVAPPPAPPPPPKPIWDDVEPESLEEREHPFLKNADPVLLGIVDHLRSVKLGTPFEFTDFKRGVRFRAKLSWYSPKTSYYIFVNQAGIQVAVKSLRTLAKELQIGETRIVPATRTPIMERALQSIHSLLSKSDRSEPEVPELANHPTSY